MDGPIHTLPDGLRAVISERPGTRTVATKVFVNAGSRYDGEQPGLSHYLEHLLFKGTKNRTSREIYAEIEAVGGRIDAQTAKEYTAFSVVTGARHYRRGLEVLSDLLLYPRFEPDDFVSEKLVILTELLRRADTRQVLWDLYDLTMWQVHPLRHRVLGYESTLETLALDDVVRQYRRYFGPRGTVIAMSGDVDAGEVLEVLRAIWRDDFPTAPEYPSLPREPALTERRTNHAPREIRQTHLVLGWPTVAMKHPDSYVLKVIDRILGAGGNCRLYQELRERQGLVYAVHTVRAEHEDLGHFSVYTATDPKSVQQAIDVVLGEIERLQREPVSPTELETAKTNYEGSLAVSFETNLKMAGISGVETLLMGDFEPFEEAIRCVQAVSADDISRVANEYFDTDRYAMATLGPEAPSGP